MALISIYKVVSSVPASLDANAVYLVRTGTGFDLYVSDSTGSIAYQINSSGGGSSEVVDDTTPQLGGDLDLNGNDIVGTGNISITGEIEAGIHIGSLRGEIQFKAKAGEALTKGDPVYISSYDTVGNTPIVAIADANDSSKMPCFGLANESVSLNASVNVVTFGTLSGLDTSGFSLGDTLYISTTGTLTNSKPSGESSLIQNIGKVQRVDNSAGAIKVGGAGRTNDVPNLNQGNVFIGNASNQAETRGLTLDDIAETATNKHFTSGDETKLNGIESGATADQTDAEIKTAYESNANTNAFTDAEKTKLSGIAAGAEVNVNADWNAISGDAQILNKPATITSAEQAKLGYISVTQAVDLDTMESDIATNNAKISNATHTGDVTGSTALTISDEAVTNAKMAHVATGTVKGRTTAGLGDVEDLDIDTTLKNALNLNKADVGLGSVPNTDCTNASNISSGTLDEARLPTINADNTTISNLEVDNLKVGILDTDLTAVSTGDDTLASAKAIKAYVDANTHVNADWNATSGPAEILNKPTTITSAEQAKLGNISVTQAVDLDAMESDIVANNAKISNATHTGDVTGSTALTISDEAVTNAKMAHVAPSTVKGRVTAGTGDVEDLEIEATLKPALNLTLDDSAETATNKHFTASDETKLNGIESGATADQTDAEIKTAYESNTDTNAFTDAEKTKLSGIAAGAEVNVNADWDAISGDAQILNKPATITSSERAKLGHILVTQEVDLDDLEADTAANNAKVTNATHTGDVTGSTVLTIANEAVTNTKLAHIATGTVKGRTTAGTGDVEDLAIETTLKSALNLGKADVGLSNVPNLDTTNASNISSGTLAEARLPIISPTGAAAGDLVDYMADNFPRKLGSLFDLNSAAARTYGIFEVGVTATNMPPNFITNCNFWILRCTPHGINNGMQELLGADRDNSTDYTFRYVRTWESGNYTDWRPDGGCRTTLYNSSVNIGASYTNVPVSGSVTEMQNRYNLILIQAKTTAHTSNIMIDAKALPLNTTFEAGKYDTRYVIAKTPTSSSSSIWQFYGGSVTITNIEMYGYG